MARPIKETPVSESEDARRFIERMNETRVESVDKKNIWLAHYRLAMTMCLETNNHDIQF